MRLTNAKDCVKRGLIRDGEDPLTIAAEQLKKDKVEVLHTIGGDDTNTTAADLAKYLKEHGYNLQVSYKYKIIFYVIINFFYIIL